MDDFSASPALVIGDGGTVTLGWDVTGAESATIDPAVGAVTPVAHGTVAAHVSANTTFTLTATAAGGTASRSAAVTVCDPAPASLTGTCNIPSAGQCIDFSGLGSSDRDSVQSLCQQLGGAWGSASCATAGRLGTCQVPPLSPRTGVSCSTSALILERYFPPQYSAVSAQAACSQVTGAVFSPG